MNFQDKAVVVTGASRGLGAALAKALAAKGARVGLVARSKGPLDEVVGEIRAAGGVAHGIVADVASKDDVYAVAGAAAALLGDVDAVVHNASTLGPVPLKLLGDTACEELEATLQANLVGPFRLTKALAGPMLVRGEGLVVSISSDAAVSAYPRWGAYGVSKAALDHLSRIWAAELEGTGVRFVSVDPGEMDTRMHADAMPEADRTTLASPLTVAARIVAMLEDPQLPSGSRREAAAGGAR